MLDGGQIGKIYPLPFASLRRNPSAIWFAPGLASTLRPTSTWLAKSGDALLRRLSALSRHEVGMAARTNGASKPGAAESGKIASRCKIPQMAICQSASFALPVMLV